MGLAWAPRGYFWTGIGRVGGRPLLLLHLERQRKSQVAIHCLISDALTGLWALVFGFSQDCNLARHSGLGFRPGLFSFPPSGSFCRCAVGTPDSLRRRFSAAALRHGWIRAVSRGGLLWMQVCT